MNRLISSHLTFKNATDEDAFVHHVMREVEYYRRELGYDPNAEGYRENTLLWRWNVYQERYEQDFSRRVSDPLFAESNLSLNLPLTQVTQHADKMGNDLLEGPAFFGPTAEGAEDENPAVDVLKQRLLFRSKQIGLHKYGKAAMLGALIRGQEILRASYTAGAYLKPTLIQPVLIDGRPLKDSQGQPVLATDKWRADEFEDGVQVLDRDPAVKVPEGALQLGRERVVMQRVTDHAGADFRVIHYGDFVTVPNAESIDAAHMKGHFFRQSVGDLMVNYPPESREAACAQYIKDSIDDQLPGETETDYMVKADQVRRRDGEDDKLASEPIGSTPARFRRRIFYSGYTRYDADGDGYAEDIYFLIDWEKKIPIHYEYASILIPWESSPHPHDYVCFRIWPKLHRWTGRGYYELLDVWAEVTDRMLNRIEIDAATSGNVLFEDQQATAQGMIGEGIQFRTRTSYDLRAGKTAQDALQVVTVQPANIQVFSELMNQFIGRQEIQGGTTSPQEASVANVPGSDTLGVAKILENTANQSLRARESEILEGLTTMLNRFAAIEVYAIQQNPQALIDQVGEAKATELLSWLSKDADKLPYLFEVSLTKAHSSEMVETGNAIVGVLEKWQMIPAPFKPAYQRLFASVLKGLGDANPDDTLTQIIDAEQAMLAQAQEAQALAEQAGPVPPEAGPEAGGPPALEELPAR